PVAVGRHAQLPLADPIDEASYVCAGRRRSFSFRSGETPAICEAIARREAVAKGDPVARRAPLASRAPPPRRRRRECPSGGQCPARTGLRGKKRPVPMRFRPRYEVHEPKRPKTVDKAAR